MKNFGNRLGYRNNNYSNNNSANNNNVEFISDARQVLSAKRNTNNANSTNNNYNGNKANVDARLMIPNFNSNQNRPKIDFTIPQKTVPNELYHKDKPQPSNFPIKSHQSRLGLSTNKFSGKNFCDVRTSQGIFSNRTVTNDTDTHTHTTGHNYNYTPYHSQHSHRQQHNQSSPVVTVGPVKSAPKPQGFIQSGVKRLSNQSSSIKSNDSLRSDQKISSDKPKKMRESSVENMTFTVVNPGPAAQTPIEPVNKKPALSTAKFAKKAIVSLVSPIQGYRIEIKNLHSQVNVDDVYELFTSLGGELRSCNLVRPGYAEVVFRRLCDAERSIDEFHGRELDGKPMNLKLVTAAVESVSNDASNDEIKGKIMKIQANRKPAHTMQINKDAVFRSIYAKSTAESLKINKKPFKFSVTL